MFRKTLIVTAAVAGFSWFGAAPSLAIGYTPLVDESGRSSDGHGGNDVILAQANDVEVYFDGDGNRVLVDSFTGEILSVERPRRPNRQSERRQLRARELNRQERYYLDDPQDMERYRRDRRGELDRGISPPVDDFPEYRQDGYGDTGANRFPRAPDQPYFDEGQPDVVTREPIERRTLDRNPAALSEPGASGEVTREPGNPQDIPGLPQETIVEPDGKVNQPKIDFTARTDVAGLQILLDRAGASPGVIDGKFGGNVDKALAAYRQLTGENLHSTDTAAIKAALAATGGDPFITYTITAADAAGPFVASVPVDYSHKAKLDRLSYTSVQEMLAEKFHMDEGYLRALNPEANFTRPGTTVRVANIGVAVQKQVSRIIADKRVKQVRAYDASGNLVAAYPATIGSSDTPSPSGTHKVARIAFDPDYTYNPKLNFKQGDNDKVLTIPPGPNGPVGSIWIALDKPTYGIHGTPDPSKIGKTESHGCVRLTNWDAQELARIVKPGVSVEFHD